MAYINSGRFEDHWPDGGFVGAWGLMADGAGGVTERYSIGWRNAGNFMLQTIFNPQAEPASDELYFREKITLQNRHHPTHPTLGIAVNYNHGPHGDFDPPEEPWPLLMPHVVQGSIEPVDNLTGAGGENASPVRGRPGHPEDEALHYFNFPFGVEPAVDGSTHVWGQFDGRLPAPLDAPPPDTPGEVFFPEGLNWGGGTGSPPAGLEDDVWVAGVLQFITPTGGFVPPGTVDIFEWWAVDHMVAPAPEPGVLVAGAVRSGALSSEEA